MVLFIFMRFHINIPGLGTEKRILTARILFSFPTIIWRTTAFDRWLRKRHYHTDLSESHRTGNRDVDGSEADASCLDKEGEIVVVLRLIEIEAEMIHHVN